MLIYKLLLEVSFDIGMSSSEGGRWMKRGSTILCSSIVKVIKMTDEPA